MVSSTFSNFKGERGIFLEKLQQERASSHNDGGTSWFFSSCGGILHFRQGTQGASHVAPRKSNLHSRSWGNWVLLSSHCRANRPLLGSCTETPCSSPVAKGSWGCIQGSPRESGLVSRGSKELCSPLELQRVSFGAH